MAGRGWDGYQQGDYHIRPSFEGRRPTEVISVASIRILESYQVQELLVVACHDDAGVWLSRRRMFAQAWDGTARAYA